MSIARNLGDKEVRWAMYDDSQVFPHGAKDPGEMTDKEISVCVDNAIPHVRYTQTMV
jgi:hypothetical protein